MRGKRQSVEDVVKRWQKLDQLLVQHDRYTLSELARMCGVDEDTIRRDLKAFGRLGYKAVAHLRMGPHAYGHECHWFYDWDQRPMFTATVEGKRRREARERLAAKKGGAGGSS
jgi:hypothetical protein